MSGPRNVDTRIVPIVYLPTPVNDRNMFSTLGVGRNASVTKRKQGRKLHLTTPKSIIANIETTSSMDAAKRFFEYSSTGKINFNFTRVAKSTKPSGIPISVRPFIFGAPSNRSDQPSERMERFQQITRKDRLDRHKKMFKSRFMTWNTARIDAALHGVRLNKRFDLMMKFREEQMSM